MQAPPMRGFDEEILKEPNVYRTYEAITHYGQAIKMLINEQCGDGIMSAIDFFMDVGTTTGKLGEKRVVITFNGKFLPFIEQRAADNGAPSPRALKAPPRMAACRCGTYLAPLHSTGAAAAWAPRGRTASPPPVAAARRRRRLQRSPSLLTATVVSTRRAGTAPRHRGASLFIRPPHLPSSR